MLDDGQQEQAGAHAQAVRRVVAECIRQPGVAVVPYYGEYNNVVAHADTRKALALGDAREQFRFFVAEGLSAGAVARGGSRALRMLRME